jgi:predicted dehydrogenase
MREIFDDTDVDGVVVGTPEHWHALATVWACQAGKDVYVEKCPTLTVWEGRKMTEAAAKYERVVQIGTQNRSAPYALSAREYIRSGKLGRVVHVKVFNMLGGGPWKPLPDSDPPKELDWDTWLGPAPWVPYNPGRHNQGGARGWGNWWAYSGCPLSDDGSHNLDLARLAIGDPPHPTAVYSAGGRIAFKDRRETPDMLATTYDFGDFTMTVECTTFTPYTKKSGGDVRNHDTFPYWPQNATRIEIYGTKRMMYLGRHGGGWQVMEGNAKVVASEYGRFPDAPHQRNFIACIRSRKQPNGDPEQGHRSATLVHLANVAHRVGNTCLRFDGKTERFRDSDAANELLKPAYRKHYRIPEEV